MPDNPPYWRNYVAVKHHREYYHKHHVFPAANRKLCDEDGLVIFLTPLQHERIHKDIEYRRMTQRAAQRVYESVIGSRNDFTARYGRNYL